jgi:Disulphide bond corrector protein DsbC/AhpC/TSA family
VLGAFGAAYKIEYPLLSDAGSKVIRAFGILNTNVPEEMRMLYGIPFPVDYLIGSDGRVRDKTFIPDYQYRPSASQVVLRNFADDGQGNSVRLASGPLTAKISLSTDRCFPGQEVAVSLTIHLQPGWHIYGRPLPSSYQPTELNFAGAIVGAQSLELPPPRSVEFAALGETLPAYEGELHAVGKLRTKWSAPEDAKFLTGLFGQSAGPGLHRIKGTLRFQACSDTVCEPPSAIQFELPLVIEAGVPPAPKAPA